MGVRIYETIYFGSAKPDAGGGSSLVYNTSVYELLGKAEDGILEKPNMELNLVFDGVKDISNNALESAFDYSASQRLMVSSISFPDLTEVNGINALARVCAEQQMLETAYFPLVEKSSGSAFENSFSGCTSLKEFDLPKYETISMGGEFNNTCYGCSSLVVAQMTGLKQIQTNQCFTGTWSNIQGLKRLWLPALEEINGNYNFSDAISGADDCVARFPALTYVASGDSIDNFATNNMNVRVHFPIDMESAMDQFPNVQNNFGAMSGQVLFDIVRTIEDNQGNTYTRVEKLAIPQDAQPGEPDFEFSAMAWYDANENIVYTAGTEPNVDDAIYSDNELTVVIDTVATIA